MNLNRMFLALLAALLLASPAAAAVPTAGIPADTHLMYGADFTSPALQALAKASFDKIKASPAFATFLGDVEKESGIRLSPAFLDRLLTIAGFRVGLVMTAVDTPDPLPAVTAVIQFKDAAAAQNADATLKDKFGKELAKDVVVGEVKIGGKTLVSLDKTDGATTEFAKSTFKKVNVAYLLEGDSIAFYLIPKDEAHRKGILPVVEASLSCLADPKKSVAEAPGYKDLLARAGGDSPIVVYVSSAFVDVANKQKANIPPVIEWLGMTSLPSADYLNIKSKVTLKLKNLEKSEAPMPVPVPALKALLAGGDCGMSALPKDTLFALGFTLNLTKDILALPEVAGVLAEQKKNGLDLEERLLKWFDGEIALGVGGYVPPTPEEMKKNEFNAPDVYLVLKTKDAAATMKSIEEFLKLSPFPMQPVDQKDLGENVKNVPLPMVPPTVKNFALHYGVAGPHFVIATTKSGMQKALECAKAPGLVGTPEFKESVEGKGFAAFYANIEEISKLDKLVKQINPGAMPTDDITFQKRMGFTVSFPGDAIVLAMGSKADYSEAIDFMLNELKKKLGGGDAPKGDAPTPAGGDDDDEDEDGEETGDGKTE